MKSAIVTGANGFVGYWLVRELCGKGIHVTAVVKDKNENISMFDGYENIDIVYCDLAELNQLPDRVRCSQYDVFYHLAWIAAGGAGRADYDIQLKNVKYACDAVGVAKSIGCKKILFAGTVTERVAEKSLFLPNSATNNVYGICKHFTHYLVNVECCKHNIDYVWMQFSNLYGPHSVNGNIVGYTLKELLKGNVATFGPANQPYDLLYIEDLVYAAYLLGEQNTNKHLYYIGSGNVSALSEWLLQIGRILGKEYAINIGARPDDGTRYDVNWFDISDLKKDTSYTPQFKLEQGITKTAEWLKTII